MFKFGYSTASVNQLALLLDGCNLVAVIYLRDLFNRSDGDGPRGNGFQLIITAFNESKAYSDSLDKKFPTVYLILFDFMYHVLFF